MSKYGDFGKCMKCECRKYGTYYTNGFLCDKCEDKQEAQMTKEEALKQLTKVSFEYAELHRDYYELEAQQSERVKELEAKMAQMECECMEHEAEFRNGSQQAVQADRKLRAIDLMKLGD